MPLRRCDSVQVTLLHYDDIVLHGRCFTGLHRHVPSYWTAETPRSCPRRYAFWTSYNCDRDWHEIFMWTKQEAQLSPRDRAMRRVSWNLANCHDAIESLSLPIGAPHPGRISRRSLASGNRNPWAIVWCCLCDPTFSRFSRTPTCDRQTDRQTDTGRRTQGHSIYRACIASRGKNEPGENEREIPVVTPVPARVLLHWLQ